VTLWPRDRPVLRHVPTQDKSQEETNLEHIFMPLAAFEPTVSERNKPLLALTFRGHCYGTMGNCTIDLSIGLEC